MRNKKRTRKGAVIKSALRFAVLLILLLFTAAAAFLQVEEITVTGNYHESADDVRAAVLERAPGKSLVLACLLNDGRRVLTLPFIESLDVSIVDTRTLSVAVEERAAVGCFNAQNAAWYFDAKGRLLFARPAPEAKNEGHFIPLCEGIKIPKKPDSDEDIDLSAGVNLEIRRSLFEDIAAVQAWSAGAGVYPDLISFDENENMTLIFGDLRVEMGGFGKLSGKLNVLTGFMPDILSRSGTLDLKKYDGTQKDIYFF